MPEPCFAWGARTYVMGILNLTPDSFSGDGLDGDPAAAVAMGQRFAQEGADLLDLGGESTRPGAAPVAPEVEQARVIPPIAALARAVAVPLSIDTYRARTAELALDAGAIMVNDVWGLQQEPDLARVVAERDAWLVVMHNQREAVYRDLVGEVRAGLRRSLDRALAAGVAWDKLIVDPGFGFGKTAEHNLELLRRLPELRALGRPILVGLSRKSTIGKVLNLPVDQRLEGTMALTALAVRYGADIVRVHDVQAMTRVARMADAIVRASARREC